jgi:hypothetical protein
MEVADDERGGRRDFSHRGDVAGAFGTGLVFWERCGGGAKVKKTF